MKTKTNPQAADETDDAVNAGNGFVDVVSALTLKAIREACDVEQATAVPLAFDGTVEVSVMVEDENDDDCCLAPFNLTFQPGTTAWDVMREVARRCAAAPVMDDFRIVVLRHEDSVTAKMFADRILTAEEWAALSHGDLQIQDDAAPMLRFGETIMPDEMAAWGDWNFTLRKIREGKSERGQPWLLTGPHLFTVMVMDEATEQWFKPFVVAVTPDMTGWDLMRTVARHCEPLSWMDDFRLGDVHYVTGERHEELPIVGASIHADRPLTDRQWLSVTGGDCELQDGEIQDALLERIRATDWATVFPGVPDDDDLMDGTWRVRDADIREASFALAYMLLGPDDDTIDRDEIEVLMQHCIRKAFWHGWRWTRRTP